MTGSLRQRSPDTWELRVSVGKDPVSGRYKTITRTHRGNKTQARRALAEFVNEVAEGRHAGTDATLGTLLERWLEMVASELSPTTLDGYRSNLETHVRPYLGNVPLRKLEPAVLDEFYARLKRPHDGRAALKVNTVRQIHAIIRRACRQGVVWKWLPSNPAVLASPGALNTPEQHPPGPADVLRLIDAAGETRPDLAVLLRLAAATGARRGELCALRWRHLDLEGGVVRIERAIIETGPGKATWSEKTTKTKNQRKVSLDPHTIAVLGAHRAAAEETAAALGIHLTPAAYVFTTEPDGSVPMRPSSVTQAVRRLRDRLGLAGVSTKALRHFQATQLLGAGVPVKDVAARLGHADAAITLNVYGHSLQANDQAAAVVMGGLLTTPGGPPSPEPPAPE